MLKSAKKKTGLSSVMSMGAMLLALALSLSMRAAVVWIASRFVLAPWTDVKVSYWWAFGVVLLMAEVRELFVQEKK